MALEQEERVGEEIYKLFELARETKDYRAEQFMQWFVKEQVEEVALMQNLLNVVERAKDNLLLVEDFIAREALGDEGGGDPTAPPPPAAVAAGRARRGPPPRRASGAVTFQDEGGWRVAHRMRAQHATRRPNGSDCRREDGAWKIVHRHADNPGPEPASAGLRSSLIESWRSAKRD